MTVTVVIDAVYEDALDVGHSIIVVGELVTDCRDRWGASTALEFRRGSWRERFRAD